MKTLKSYIPTITIIILVYLPTLKCNLQKISYTQIPNKVTSIQLCKTFNSVIYTTQNGYVHQWLAFQKTNDYQISGTRHQITCGRYSYEAQHAYIGILTNQGRVKIMEEVYSTITPITSYLQFVNLIVRRSGNVTDLSIGLNYVALGYKTTNTIDIYYLPNPDKIPTTLTLPTSWNAIRMDNFDNLIIATSINQVIIIDYYRDLSLTKKISITINQTLAPTSSIKIDYKNQLVSPDDPNSSRKLSFFVMYNNVGMYIHYNQATSTLTSSPYTSPSQKLCNNNPTTLSTPQNKILTQNPQIYIDTIPQKILDYTCLPQTQSYVQYMYYILSTDGTNYYIDAYDIVSGWLYWIIAGIVFVACCCGCISGIVKNNGWRDCKELVQWVCKGCYMLFLWCPTTHNMEELTQSIQN